MFPTDDRHAVAVVLIQCGVELLAGQCAGIVLGALIALFQNHVALGLDIGLRQAQIVHPVAFHLHHQGQAVGSNTLKISGIIVTGKGVVGPAVSRDNLGKFAAFQRVCGLEQQVFKKMRNTGRAHRFIRGPDLIPYHLHHGGGAVVFDHNDIHAVIKGVGRHLLGQSRQGGERQKCRGNNAAHGQSFDGGPLEGRS